MGSEGLRILVLKGEPRWRGRQHGEELRAEIGRHLDLFLEDIGRDTGLVPREYLARFLSETDFLPAVKKYTPDLLEEVRGIAEGAGRSFDEVFARQLSDEDPWFRQVVKYGRPMPPVSAEHCSSLGALGRGGLPNLIAQNMDSPGYYDGFQLLLRVGEEDGERECLVFTVAGKLSLAGLNSRGLGICCNTLLQLDFNRRGLPEDFIVRKVLQQDTLASALEFMRSIPHASGQNYTLGSPDGVIDLECSAGQVCEFEPLPTQGRVYHTNHPLVNPQQAGWDAMWAHGRQVAPQLIAAIEARMTTFRRLETLRPAVENAPVLDVESAARILSLHEGPVCCHHQPDASYTLGCLVMECTPRPILHLAGGPPCTTPFFRYTFD
jgi:isopenicillin-N N-acyltransferase like protein